MTVIFTATAEKPATSIPGGSGDAVQVTNEDDDNFDSVQEAVNAVETAEAEATTVEIGSGTFDADGEEPISVNDPNGLQFRGTGSSPDDTVLAAGLELSGGSPVDGVATSSIDHLSTGSSISIIRSRRSTRERSCVATLLSTRPIRLRHSR